MQAELYTSLKAQIETLATIKHVSLWNNQFQRENEEKAFKYPCVFIEFADIIYTDLTKNVQQYSMNVNLHLGFSDLATDPITILTLKQSLFVKVQGFLEGYGSKLLRRSETQNFDHDNVQEYIIRFETSGKDFAADDRATVTATVTNLNITNDAIITNQIINTASPVIL